MHILLTNDDGPPSPTASPYILTFARLLRSPPFSHKVSVVLPSTQRSWIGKAHLLPPTSFPVGGQGSNDHITDVIKPSYYDPEDGSLHESPMALERARNGRERKVVDDGEVQGLDDYYVLIPGTPATCVQLGLFHHDLLFLSSTSTTTITTTNTASSPPSPNGSRQTPIDLVLSGPNYGRNTTAAFALSSGTIGGALEGAVCGVRAIALSFAFFTRQEPPELTLEACTLGAKIVEALMADWDGSSSGVEGGGEVKPELYTINVPLVEGVASRGVRWTWMLGNKWGSGSLYKAIEPGESAKESGGNANGRTGESLLAADKTYSKGDVQLSDDGVSTFKWGPTFTDIWKTVEQSQPGNDGLTIREHVTSVTPLMANYQGFRGVERYKGELKL